MPRINQEYKWKPLSELLYIASVSFIILRNMKTFLLLCVRPYPIPPPKISKIGSLLAAPPQTVQFVDPKKQNRDKEQLFGRNQPILCLWWFFLLENATQHRIWRLELKSNFLQDVKEVLEI